MNDAVLLVINAAPELEHALVDTLLSMDDVNGFTSIPVRGHGAGGAMTIAEQVAGRRQRMQFQIMLDASRLSACLDRLNAEFGDSGLVYWAYRLCASGRLTTPKQTDATPARTGS